MKNKAVEFKNFYYAYNGDELALKNINFGIREGSFTVLLGPSGAGKTTLCKAMAGIIPYYYGGRYAGSVEVLGEDTKGRRVSDIDDEAGLMLEDYESQLVSLTAGEEVSFSLLNHGFPPEKWRSGRARLSKTSACPVVRINQIGRIVRRPAAKVAAGLGAGRAPRVIVLDEPVSAMESGRGGFPL
jgi:energy-coupling factor transport system ATP-binding protein